MIDIEDSLAISGLQHFSYCKRQWALIHIEGLWQDNTLTAQGSDLHARAHDHEQSSFRDGILTIRSLPLSSKRLGLYGEADVVEFYPSESGISIEGYSGCFTPQICEYKRGHSKLSNCDRLQVCAQSICLEEMLACSIKTAALFYGEPRRREKLDLTDTLRLQIATMCSEMHGMVERMTIPKPEYKRGCESCSLISTCIPKMKFKIGSYWEEAFKEEDKP